MVLDSKINKLKEHFNINKVDDWEKIQPSWILGVEDIGPVTLDHIRIYLAARGKTLAGDQTPEYWQRNLASSKIGQRMGSLDKSVVCPFTVLIDTREQLPWTFQGYLADADQKYAPMIVPCDFVSLGDGWADYSIRGFQQQCHIERKSIADAHGTILGWGERRDQFQATLANLAGIECAAVVVECSFGQLIQYAPDRGKKSKEENAKILHRQVIAWEQDFRVPWVFCDTKRFAEQTAFRIMYRFWKKAFARRKQELVNDVAAIL